MPTEPDKATAFLAKCEGKANIYYAANALPEATSKKATKRDVQTGQYLYVDLDPRAGEDPVAERDRILQLVEDWPFDLPRPNLAVWSGGGAQLLWRLDEPFVINGDEAAAAEYERYNRALEDVLGGDNCHNCDRILRLPGTTNLPDEKKRAKGRVAAPAFILHIDDGTVSLGDITPAPPKDAPADNVVAFRPAGPATPVSQDELDTLPAVLAALANTGQRDPDNPVSDRSAVVLDFVCNGLRAGTDPALLYRCLLDPGLAISAHVRKQKKPEAYARRQLERAQSRVADDPGSRELDELNERYAVIQNLGGKCLVVEELYDAVVKRPRLTKISPPNFQQAWRNRAVQVAVNKDGNPVYKPLGTWWLDHPQRRQYTNLVFAPERDVPGSYNLWQGFGVEAQAGDCSLYLEHIEDNICGGDPRLYQYVLGWMANAVQNPASPGHSAIVLRGRQGTGKSFFAKHFGHLFGRHYLQVGDAKHMVGSFNNHLRDCVILFGDEAFYAGDKKHESVLKTLVTEEVLAYEAKGVDAEQGPNFVHLIMASNSAWVVPADMDDRRFLVLDVSDRHRLDTDYFGAIYNQLTSGGYEALLHYLQSYALDDFQIRNVPGTAAKDEQKLFTASAMQKRVHRLLLSGEVEPLAVRGRDVFIATKYLARREGIHERFETALGRELGKAAKHADDPNSGKSQRLVVGSGGKTTEHYQRYVAEFHNSQPRGYWLPSLHQARRNWAEAHQLDLRWDERIDWDLPEGGDDGIPF